MAQTDSRPMKTPDIQNLAELLKPFFEEIGVEKAIMFGSSSKGSDTRRSDIDLVVIMETNKRFFDRYQDLERIYDLVSDKALDLLIYNPDELNRIAHRPFIKKILSEGHIIYEH